MSSTLSAKSRGFIIIVSRNMEIPAAELWAELEGLKPRALQKRAEQMGVDEDALDAAEDAAATIQLIMAVTEGRAAQRVAVAEAERRESLRSELLALKPRALQKRAEEAGIEEEELDAADDTDAIVELIMGRVLDLEPEVAAARLAALKHELQGLKPRALSKRAEEMGIAEDELDAGKSTHQPCKDGALISCLARGCGGVVPHLSARRTVYAYVLAQRVPLMYGVLQRRMRRRLSG